ncbi:MAG TPA: S41 family peptidase [Candidatus Binatia bacterium]|nr:S41 family peptidase [Candidatus Binatia bacterium]
MKRWIPLILALALTSAAVRLPASAANGMSTLEHDELDTSFNRMTSEFYKKVDAQVLLDGVHTQLLSFLVKNGVPKPSVPAAHASDDQQATLRELDREVNAVVTAYGTKFPSRQITYEAISGLLGAVHDKYTVFLSPKQYADLNEGLDGGNFGGVGLSMMIDDATKMLRVNDVIPEGPAEKSGVQADDIITTINGKTTKGLTTEQDSKMLRGTPGTRVIITILRTGQSLQAPITITRAMIHAPSVFSKMLPNHIGYAQLTVFGLNTASELSKALAKLDGDGAKGFILDLRNNGGGYLNAAIDVSSKFVPTGPIVTVEARQGNNTEFDAENTAIMPRPLVVLVNKLTASASEITSGAIQDNGVGTLIGMRTYGKGVVQTIYPLPDGSAVKITTARYLTPKGRDINTVGIAPDIVADENASPRYGDPTRDTQLQTALTYLQGKIAQNSDQ